MMHVIRYRSVDCNATSYLEVVGNLVYRCSDSSPRRMRENRYPILVKYLELPTFSTYKRAYRFLFSKCRGMDYTNPATKLYNYYEIVTIMRGDRVTTQASKPAN